MKPLSNAIRNSRKSSIRKLFELVLASEDAISLGIGQPDFPTPAPVIEGIKRALDEGKTMYAPTLGIPQLRARLAEKFRRENDMDWVTPEHVIVTNGGSQALNLAFAVLANPGDAVAFCSPNFLSYFYLATYHGLKLQEVPRRDDFSLDVTALEAALTPETKFLVINSPNNPTGYAYTRAEMDAIVDLVVEHDLYLVSDEVYEYYCYEGRTAASPAAREGLADRVLTLNAASKTFSATGLRVGYVAASRAIIGLMEKYAQYTSAGVNHPTQYGVLAGFEAGIDHVHEVARAYDAKRQYCVNRLRALGFDCPTPYGAFYVMPSVAPFASSSAVFSTGLMEAQAVAVVPGDAFGSFSEHRVRISYATTDETLRAAFDRIETYVNAL